MAGLMTPIITIVIGEGGSGGALGIVRLLWSQIKENGQMLVWNMLRVFF